jgi:indolepyruvate ferredoxin oxidoreductase beta subunit
MISKIDQFNIVIKGVGGQGLITLLQVIAEAATLEGYDVKTSELHGLSQRGGSVDVHVRFGKEIYSPLVAQGQADLVLGLEPQEALRAEYFANKKTKFLVNSQIVPIPMAKMMTEKEVSEALEAISDYVLLVPAGNICARELGTSVVSGIYLVSLAAIKGWLPLKPSSILAAIKKVINQKYFELNKKTFELAQTNEQTEN